MSREEKYASKLDGSSAKARADSYGKRQKRNFAAALPGQVEAEAFVKSIGAPAFLRHYYCAFAKQTLAAIRLRPGGAALGDVTARAELWGGRGLDTAKLEAIMAHYGLAIAGFTLDFSLLDGDDLLV